MAQNTRNITSFWVHISTITGSSRAAATSLFEMFRADEGPITESYTPPSFRDHLRNHKTNIFKIRRNNEDIFINNWFRYNICGLLH